MRRRITDSLKNVIEHSARRCRIRDYPPLLLGAIAEISKKRRFAGAAGTNENRAKIRIGIRELERLDHFVDEEFPTSHICRDLPEHRSERICLIVCSYRRHASPYEKIGSCDHHNALLFDFFEHL